MKTLRLFGAVLFIAIISVVSALGQSSQPVSSAKLAVINTEAFGDTKAGITKFVTALTTVNKEFEPIQIELKAMGTRYENLRKEIETLQQGAANGKTPIPQTTIQAKIDEYGKLERDIQFKQEDAKARYQSRYNIVMGPILQDISKAIQDYAKQRGFALIFDGSKLYDAGLVLGVGDDKVDVTKDFIAFYNARPAAGAAK